MIQAMMKGQIDRLLESCDLSALHLMLTLIGVVLTVYVMTLTGHVHEDSEDPKWLQWGRRAGLASVALALLWSLNYSQTKHWQPWPPELLLIASWIFVMAVRALAIHARLKRDAIRHIPAGFLKARSRN